jgi:small subunit ribosomal protein S5
MVKNTSTLENKFLSKKILEIKNVTKVLAEGKRIRARAIVIVGDQNGTLGLGLGHAEYPNLAIEKAEIKAKNNTIKIAINKNNSISDISIAKFGSSTVILKPAGSGMGVICGNALSAILKSAGIKNVSAKQLGSDCVLNNAKAAFLALIKLAARF